MKLRSAPKSFWVLCGFLLVLVMYVVILFIHLKISGVYVVATIKSGVATSDGVDYKYEFNYNGESYFGTFNGSSYKIGKRCFVMFLRDNPDKNLIQLYTPVPDCLKDSINSFWEKEPLCNQ
jgi:hypothetical protein